MHIYFSIPLNYFKNFLSQKYQNFTITKRKIYDNLLYSYHNTLVFCHMINMFRLTIQIRLEELYESKKFNLYTAH